MPQRWHLAAAELTPSDIAGSARARQADTLADSILDIADGEGDSDDKRVRIDSRKWLAGKLRPKVYGDKVAVGGDADAPPISMAFRWEQPNGS